MFRRIGRSAARLGQKLAKQIRRLWAFCKQVFNRWFEHLPISDQYKRLTAMVTASVLLVLVVLLSFPVTRTVGTAVRELFTVTGRETAKTESLTPVNENLVLAEDLDAELEIPAQATEPLPQGSAIWNFSEQEIQQLNRLLISLERCDSYVYGVGQENDPAMALAAYWTLLYQNDINLSLDEENGIYSVPQLVLQGYINGIFGRNLTQTDHLGQVGYTAHTYLLRDPVMPEAVAGYITGAYSMGKGYYRIEGLVTRGYPTDAGCSTRRMNVVLLKNSDAIFGYYVVSVSGGNASYTYLDSLNSYLGKAGYQNNSNLTGRASQPAVTTEQPVAPETVPTESQPVESLLPPTEEPPSGAEGNDHLTDITGDQNVVQPGASEHKKHRLTREEKERLTALFQSMPAMVMDFSNTSAESESFRTLAAHLSLCRNMGLDVAAQSTTNTMGAIDAEARLLFGSSLNGRLAAADPAAMLEEYTIGPFIVTSKLEFTVTNAYDLENGQYLVICKASYYSNPLLSEPDGRYTYTAVVQESDQAEYGYYLISQTFVAEP